MIIDNYSNNSATCIYRQSQLPIFQNKVYNSVAEAQNALCGEIELVQDNVSGFIYNAKFDSSLMVYDESYQNEQSNSPFFRKHLEEVLKLLIHLGIRDKKVVEIGCGKGYFLEMMRQSGIDCIGFDPTYEGENEYVLKEFFSEKTNIKADVIILRHTLEHIPRPFTFLHTIAKSNDYQGYIFIEVPTFDWIAKKEAFWDIFYEHCNYFTENTLKKMFHKAQTGYLFGGQYIYLWAKLADLKKQIEEKSDFQKVSFNPTAKIETIKDRLQKQKDIAIWGAGAKGNTFLNLLDPQRKLINFVVDINPAKQNKFIAKTAHPIFSPDILKKEPINNVWVMNKNYLDEIKRSINNTNINFHVI